MSATQFTVETRGPGLYEVTRELRAWAEAQGQTEALLTLFLRHTSASLLIQENADPEVRRDLTEFFHRLAPPTTDPSMAYLTHTCEGPDDMPAHIKAALLPTSLQIPLTGGRLALGRWQGVYLFEHRHAPHHRQITALLR
ncbi:MAG: secondary thiamine-phosphate synthase enzyme YjbQ [Paracoccaceae bacterium]|jgi:secondary thiamine-phosphate synthase enzyme